MMKRHFSSLLLILTCAAARPTVAADALELRSGDHICLIGNSLADRMQHDGWLETLLQAQFPTHRFAIRNLGFAGDELTVRQRCENFGSQEDWLNRARAEVVMAFFGFNESFAGPAGCRIRKRRVGVRAGRPHAGLYALASRAC
jgi:hypothetical protein